MKIRTKIFIAFIIIGLVSISLDVGSSLFDYSRGLHEENAKTIFMLNSYGELVTFAIPYTELAIIIGISFIAYSFVERKSKLPQSRMNVLLKPILIITILMVIGISLPHLIQGILNLWYNGV